MKGNTMLVYTFLWALLELQELFIKFKTTGSDLVFSSENLIQKAHQNYQSLKSCQFQIASN